MTTITPGQRRRLEERLKVLLEEHVIRSDKLKEIRHALAIEAGTAVHFQLKEQLLNEEAQLVRLGDEIDEYEQALSSNPT